MFSDQILQIKDQSILLFNERENTDIIIAAPHHTPFGAPYMPCEKLRPGDEGVGFIVKKTANILNCSSVIASNYFIDSNKFEDSDYFKIIKRNNLRLLTEIHGHGSKSARYDIEISAGSFEKNEISMKFAELLRKKMKGSLLEKFTVCGDWRKIYFTAQYTKTVNTSLWNAIHAELPWSIRGIPENAELFSEIAAETIREFYKLI
ncbi:MAG: hypothetical protein CSB55_06930 [Candidatus Cloacimonadota bacterium]|nr:MAG: hypothetical protein CSB55_06930 [Candidatus Cloacimonadota bacterium]